MKIYLIGGLVSFLILAYFPGCGYTVLLDPAKPRREFPEKSALTTEEMKLEWPLLEIVRLAEAADTSEQARSRLESSIAYFGGTGTRLPVSIELWGMSGMNLVLPLLDTLGAQSIRDSRSFPFISCRIRPTDLRRVVAVGSVKQVHVPHPADHSSKACSDHASLLSISAMEPTEQEK